MPKAKKTTKGGASQITETAKASTPLSLRQLVEQQGRSGVYIVHGFLEEDYNSDVSGIRGLEKFDEMRRSSSQVRATLQAMELPIRSTEWNIVAGVNDQGETDEQCEEYRAFVEEALFRKMEQTWDDHLRECCTFLPFGFCVKEKVYTLADDGKFWIKHLAHRKPQTIYKWEQEDGSAGVTQILPSPMKMDDGTMKSWVSIQASKMLLFTFQREGDNYAGISVLRSAYRHWYTVDLLYKFDAIRHERQAVGVPYMKLPKGASTADIDAAKQILKDLRANEQSGITLPDGWEFGFADLQAGNTSDIWKSIEHHNMMISKNVLAMFMELVSGDGGSRALSEDQSDFFLLALEGVAKQIDDVHNRFLIPELVDLNFDVPGQSYYPKLTHRKLGAVDYMTISNVLSSLVTAGMLDVDAPLKDYIRKIMDLPAQVVEDAPEDGLEPEGDVEIDPITGEPMEVVPEDGAAAPETDDEGNPIEPVAEEEIAEEPIDNEVDDGETEEVEDELDDDDNAELDSLESELQDVEVTDEDLADAEAEDAAEDEEDDEEEDDGEEPEGDEPEDGLEPDDEDPTEEIALEDEDLEDDEVEPLKNRKKKRKFSSGEIEVPQTFGELVRVFRIVSPATRKKISDALKAKNGNRPQPQPRYKRGQPIPEDIRRKISEALKKALPGDMDATKQAVVARKGKRMRSLTQRTLKRPSGKSSNIGTTALRKKQTASLKKPGAVTQSRTARLKKAAAAKPKLPKATPATPKPRKKRRSKKQRVQSIREALKTAKTGPERKRLKARILNMRKRVLPKTPPKTIRPKASARLSPSRKRAAARGRARTLKPAPKGVKASEEPDAAEGHQEAEAGHHHDPTSQAMYQAYASFCDWSQIIRLQNAVPRDPEDKEPRARPWQFNEIEHTSWRPLTFAEKKVNFTSLKKALAGAGAKFDAEVEAITKKQAADILAQVKRAVDADDIVAVGKIKAKYTGELSAALTKIQLEMFEAGKKSVAAEIGVKVPPTAREIAGALRVQNDKIVEKYVSDLETSAATAVTQQTARRGGAISSTATTDAVQAASESMAKAAASGKGGMKTLSVIGTLNLGRATIFERYPEEVYAMMYSAIIDDQTTDHCLSLDGRVVKPGSAEFYYYSPPQHYECRSVWVEILRDEEFPPEITGIPKSISPSKTIDTFEELKAPIIAPNSPAVKVLEKEIADRKAKIEEYEKGEQYPNRIASHQARVDALEQSLERTRSEEEE